MTGMLASVTSVVEADIVLNTGVDIIDLKNPHEGALGALDTNVVTEIVESVNGAVITSATVGDIESNDKCLEDYIYKMAATGVDIVKVGLFDSTPTEHFIDCIGKVAKQNINLVIVIFAENFYGNESFGPLLNTGINGIMLDTKDKASKNLREVLRDDVLNKFVKSVNKYELLTGLAGSLRHEDINSLLLLKPDYLGFRGALCSENNRVNQIDQYKIKNIRNAIPQHKIMNYDNREYKKETLSNGTVA